MSQKQTVRESEFYGKTKKIKVWANGDPKCYVFDINPKEFRNWDVIMSHLTQTMLPTFGDIGMLVELKTKKTITEFERLDPRRKYIGIGKTCTSLRMPIGGYKTTEELNKQQKRPSDKPVISKGEKLLTKTEKSQYTVIYLTVNGSDQTPHKVVLKRDELKQYDSIRSYLANILKMSNGVQNLCTTSGTVLQDATEFRHGNLYVVVPFGQNFCKMDYVGLFKEKYLFCKKNKLFKVVASRHSFLALKRKLSSEKANTSKKVGTSSRHSVQSQIPPLYTFKSIARERETDLLTKQTMEGEKSLPLYNDIKSRQSQFIRFTIRPAPRQPEIPKQFHNTRKIPKFIRQRLAEGKGKMRRSNTFSGPTALMEKTYLPQSVSLPTDAKTKMMKVLKKITFKPDVESVLVGGEAVGEEYSNPNAMYEYLQSLGSMETNQNPEMDIYFKTLLEKIVKIDEKKSEHIKEQKQQISCKEVTNEQAAQRFDSGAKLSIEIKQLSDEELARDQQITRGNKLFNVTVTYRGKQPSIEAVNLIKTVQDSIPFMNVYPQINKHDSDQKVSRDAIIVNNQIHENKVTPKPSCHVSVDRIYKEMATPNGSIKSSTSNTKFILQERMNDTSNKDYVISEDRIIESISDVDKDKKPVTVDTLSLSSRISNRAAIGEVSQEELVTDKHPKTSNPSLEQIDQMPDQEIDKHSFKELQHLETSAAILSSCNEQASHKNVPKESNKKTEGEIIENKYSNERNIVADPTKKLETMEAQIFYEKYKDAIYKQNIEEQELNKSDNKKQEDSDIKILFEQSICESTTQQLCQDSFERASISSSSGTQQLNLERARDVSRSSTNQLMVDKVKLGTEQVNGSIARQMAVKSDEQIIRSGTNNLKNKDVCEASNQQLTPTNKKEINISKSNMLATKRFEIFENRSIPGLTVATSNTVSEEVGKNYMISRPMTRSSRQRLEAGNIEHATISGLSLANENLTISRSSTKHLVDPKNFTGSKLLENVEKTFSRTSTKKLGMKSQEKLNNDKSSTLVEEQINISRSSMIDVKNVIESKRISGSSMSAETGTHSIRQLTSKCEEKINSSRSSILSGESKDKRDIYLSRIKDARSMENEKSYGLSIQQIYASEEQNISRSSTLAGDTVKDTTISGSSIQLAAKNGELNVSGTIILPAENIQNRMTSRPSTKHLADIEKISTISGSSIRQLAVKNGEQSNVFGTNNILTAETIQNKMTSRSSTKQLADIDKNTKNRITYSEEIDNSRLKKTLGSECTENVAISETSLQKEINVCGSRITDAENIENEKFFGISIRQLVPKTEEQAYFLKSSTLTMDSAENRKSSESSTQQLFNEEMVQSRSSILDQTNISISNTVTGEHVEGRKSSGSIKRQLSKKSLLMAENMDNMTISGSTTQQLDNFQISDNDTVCQYMVCEFIPGSSTVSVQNRRISESSTQQWIDNGEDHLNMSRSSILTAQQTNVSRSSILSENIVAAKNLENGSTSGIIIGKLAPKREEISSILGQKNIENEEQINISGSSILPVENRIVSESSSQQLSAKSKEPVNISRYNILDVKSEEQTNISLSDRLAGNIRTISGQLAEKYSKVSGPNTLSVNNRTITEITLQLAPKNGKQINKSGSNTLAADTQQFKEENLDKVSISDKYVCRNMVYELTPGSGKPSAESIQNRTVTRSDQNQTNISGSSKPNVENGTSSRSSIQRINASSEQQTNIPRSSILDVKIDENRKMSGLSIRQLAPNSENRAYDSKSSILPSERVGNGTISRTCMRKSAANSEEQIYNPKSSIPELENIKNRNNFGSSLKQEVVRTEEQTNISGLGLIAAENLENSVIFRSSIQNQKEQINHDRLSIPGSENLEYMSNLAENSEEKANICKSSSQLNIKNYDNTNISKSSILNTESVQDKIVFLKSEEQINNIDGFSELVMESVEHGNISSRSSRKQLAAKSGKQTNIYGTSLLDTSTQQLSIQGDDLTNISRLGILNAENVNKNNSGSSIRNVCVKSVEQINISGSNLLAAENVENRKMFGSGIRQLCPILGETTYFSKSSILTSKSVENETISELTSPQFVVKTGEEINIPTSSQLAVETAKNMGISKSSIRQKSAEQTNISESNLLTKDMIENRKVSGSSMRQLGQTTYFSKSGILTSESVENGTIYGSNIQRFVVKSGEQIIIPRLSQLVVETAENMGISRLSIQQKSAEQTNISMSNLLAAENIENRKMSRSTLRQFAPISGETTCSISGSTTQFVINSGDQIIIPELCVLHVESAENESNSVVKIRQLTTKGAEPTTGSISIVLDAESGSSIQLFDQTNISKSSKSTAENVENINISELFQKSREPTNIYSPSIEFSENVYNTTISGSSKEENVVNLISDHLFPGRTQVYNININNEDNITNEGHGSIEKQLHYKETIPKLLSNKPFIDNELNKTNILFKGTSAVEDKPLADERVIDEDEEGILKKISTEATSNDNEANNDETTYCKIIEDGEQIPFLQASNSPSSTTTVEHMMMILNEDTIDLHEETVCEKKSNKEKTLEVPGELVN